MPDNTVPRSTDRRLLRVILAIVAIYIVAVSIGWPRRIAVGPHDAGEKEASTDHVASKTEDETHVEDPSARAADEHAIEPSRPPTIWAVVPFVLLLGAIAVLPLVEATHHWWESNLNRFYVAAGLALVTLAYYALFHQDPVEAHFWGHGLVGRDPGPVSWSLPFVVFRNAVLGEYTPFIVLLFSLYTICGGIRISGDLPAHPWTNTMFIGVGGLLASLIGTTGAAMLLIRPLLETNSERKHVRHTVVFFIFVVCNCGGCLLPIGDPPLFLGYLEGVDFLWTLSLWKPWAFVNLSLLAIYYLGDWLIAWPRETEADRVKDERTVRGLVFEGLWPNLPLLACVVLAVALLDPGKPVPGTAWHPWIWFREIVQLSLVGLSLGLGAPRVRVENRFNYGAIVEVACLFLGIFICMQPALQILEVQGASLGIETPAQFFWITGGISAALDNAPTYLVFFKTAQTLHVAGPSQAGVPVDLLAAISLGAVFMGAMTYIGNGPNFMVKAIAEEGKVKMPGFFGYLVYSAAILLPLLLLTQWLFL